MSGPFGIIHGEDIRAYHANDAIGSTKLMDMRPCEKHFWMRHIAKTLPAPKKAEFDIGNGAHWLILEGRKALEERTVLQPARYFGRESQKKGAPMIEKPWNNNSHFCDNWTASMEEAGKVILTADDFATIDKMAAAVAENPDAVALLSGGESEVTFRVQHPAFAVQCRADHWHEPNTALAWVSDHGNGVCVDLKTCDSIEQFRAHYFKLRYYYRAALYQNVIEQIVGERPAFVFVALEKNPPWRCEVFEPSEEDLLLGRDEMLADLQSLRGCFESGVWPNSKLGVQRIELKEWQRKLSADAGAGLYAEEVTT